MPLNLNEVVIDTNVFRHAQNPNMDCFEAAKDFLINVLESKIVICIDDSDLIKYEYINKLCNAAPGLGAEILSKLWQARRVVPVGQNISSQKHRKIIERLIRRRDHQRDRTFVKVAYNTNDNVLVSHDFKHFPVPVRNNLSKHIDVEVACAGEFYEKRTGNCGSCSIW